MRQSGTRPQLGKAMRAAAALVAGGAARRRDHAPEQADADKERKDRDGIEVDQNGDLELAHRGANQGGDEEADAPGAVRAVHVVAAGHGLDAVGLDIEVDLDGAREQAGDRTGRRTPPMALGIHGTRREAEGPSRSVTSAVVRAPKPLDERSREGQRDQRADRHADQHQAQLALGDAEMASAYPAGARSMRPGGEGQREKSSRRRAVAAGGSRGARDWGEPHPCHAGQGLERAPRWSAGRARASCALWPAERIWEHA